MPEADTYLFIDGDHLRRYYAEGVNEWFAGESELDFNLVKNAFSALRCFFYDCLDDIKQAGETDSDFRIRVSRQESYFDKISKVFGTHVRLGSLTGTAKNKRQKKVDILLAVDMLSYAAQSTISRAVLLAGDRDFQPVIDSLVGRGVIVEVAGDDKHTSRHLAQAADSYRKITFSDYFAWSSEALKSQYPLPTRWNGPMMFTMIQNGHLLGKGICEDYEVKVYKTPNGFAALLSHEESIKGRAYTLDSQERLQLYIKVAHGEVIWQ